MDADRQPIEPALTGQRREREREVSFAPPVIGAQTIQRADVGAFGRAVLDPAQHVGATVDLKHVGQLLALEGVVDVSLNLDPRAHLLSGRDVATGVDAVDQRLERFSLVGVGRPKCGDTERRVRELCWWLGEITAAGRIVAEHALARARRKPTGYADQQPAPAAAGHATWPSHACATRTKETHRLSYPYSARRERIPLRGDTRSSIR